MIRSEGHHIDPPVGKRQRHGDVVGNALLPQVFHDREIELVGVRIDLLPNASQTVGHMLKRAQAKGRALQCLVGRSKALHGIVVARPHIMTAGNHRVQ